MATKRGEAGQSGTMERGALARCLPPSWEQPASGISLPHRSPLWIFARVLVDDPRAKTKTAFSPSLHSCTVFLGLKNWPCCSYVWQYRRHKLSLSLQEDPPLGSIYRNGHFRTGIVFILGCCFTWTSKLILLCVFSPSRAGGDTMTLLPQQNVLLILPQQTRIVVLTISTVTTIMWIATRTTTVVAVTSDIVSTNILVCWGYINSLPPSDAVRKQKKNENLFSSVLSQFLKYHSLET